MPEPQIVSGRLEGARSLIKQGEVMPELNRDGLASLLTDAIDELSAYDSLLSQLREEIEMLRHEAADWRTSEFARRKAELVANRLSKLLPDSKEGEG